ncbi:hypothetical protein FB451DRAFT_992886, partial [Mycena latifolia]
DVTYAPRGPFVAPRPALSASRTTSGGPARRSTLTASTHAPSAAVITPRSPATAPVSASAPEYLSLERAPQAPAFLEHRLSPPSTLTYTDLTPFVHIREPLPGPPDHLSPILDRIVQPYDADAFHTLLRKHNLHTAYPDLVRNLCQGFAL